ncbi:MAG: type IV toxin-antitoxin system AbiEi family antitoxin domain-containing protein [Actinomycetota bacterium]
MARQHATPLPMEIATRALRVIRPRDAADIYRNPPLEFARLTRAGLLLRIARGYYAIPPMESLGTDSWRPAPESIALGIGMVDYGKESVALAGISAARVLNVLPRALAAGVVAVPASRNTLRTIAGPLIFWTRDTSQLQTQKTHTELVTGWVTTSEQTLLDLADVPDLGGVSPTTASEAIWALATRVDWGTVFDLSVRQRRRAAYTRALWASAGLISEVAPPPWRSRRSVSSRGLRSWSDASPERFGVLA